MHVHEAIATIRAIRSFDSQPLTDEDVAAIVGAARRAQSAMNSQPWDFIAVRDRAMLERLADVSGHAGHLRTAGCGVLILLKAGHWSTFDGGGAAAMMQLAAWERGIASCLGSFEDPEKARQLLGWPEDLTLLISISFGRAPNDAMQRPLKRGGRRPLAEVLHAEHW